MKPPTKRELTAAKEALDAAQAAVRDAEATLNDLRAASYAAGLALTNLELRAKAAKLPADLQAAIVADPASWSDETLKALHRRGLVATDWRWNRTYTLRALNYPGQDLRRILTESE